MGPVKGQRYRNASQSFALSRRPVECAMANAAAITGCQYHGLSSNGAIGPIPQLEWPEMKLGLNIGYNLGARVPVPMAEIRLAQELGFDSVWTAETYGSDVFSPLAFIAAGTQRIRLCTGVAQLAARTPANCAMTAQTNDQLAGGGGEGVGLVPPPPRIGEG